MDFLTGYAMAQPDKPAVICDDEIITFAELERRANKLANALLALGVNSGDKVTTSGYNAPEHFVAGSAIRKIVGVGIPMNYRLRPAEIEYQLNNSDSVAVFCGPEMVEAVQSARAACPKLRFAIAWGDGPLPDGWLRFDEVLESGDTAPPDIDTGGLMGATMSYTAGTTGNPKGAYREKGADPVVVATWIQAFGLSTDDVHLVAGPMYHSAPAAFAGITTLLGATNVLMRKYDPARALELVGRHQVSTTFMAPTLLQRIVQLPKETLDRYDASSMRVIIVAAAPCPFELKRRVLDYFGPTLWEFYGSSEAGVNTIMRPEEQLTKPGSCGKIAPGVEVKILDEAGNQCPPGVPGELYLKTDAIITEYYGNPEATQSSWRDGYFTVGDVGYLDDDGYLYISDRKRDMIISGGANIYCAEVENVIHSHPAVWDVAVIGIPSDEWGEAVHAVVQPKPGAAVTEREIVDWVAERLAGYKKPHSVEFREDFPRDEAGKIRKRDLREPFWAGRTTRV